MWFGREYGFAFHFLNEKQTKKKELLLKEKKARRWKTAVIHLIYKVSGSSHLYLG